MAIALNIIFGSTLLITFWQDWKFRAVHWLVFLALALTAIFSTQQSGSFDISHTTLNVIFVLAVTTGLFLWLSLKEGKFVNLFENYFGFGDFLFLISVTPFFAPTNFFLFFISGMLLSAITHASISRSIAQPTIPLAGYLAIYLLGLKVIQWSCSVNPFQDNIF